jgi:uncharacterized damage-inducible protein DinB
MDSTPADTLSTFYDGWDAYQNRLIETIAPLTADQLALRPAPGLRTLEQMTRHILAARARWMHWMLGEGGEEIAALTAWDTWDPADTNTRTTDELVAGLHTTWSLIRSALIRWTPAEMAENVTGTWGDQTDTFSRQWVIWHLLEHDLRHGGEVALTLGIHGLTALDL